MGTSPRMLSIVEMSARYGVTLRALRFYEQSGLLKPTREGSHRIYAAKDQARLELILKGKRLGFTLQEICTLIEHTGEPAGEDEDADLVSLLDKDAIDKQTKFLEQRMAEVDEAIAELKAALHRISDVDSRRTANSA